MYKILWGCAIISMIFSYPAQVIFGSNFYALTPFLFLAFIILLRVATSSTLKEKFSLIVPDYFVIFFALYIIFYSMLSLLLGNTSVYVFASNIVSYILPMMFYIVIRHNNSRDVITIILYFIFIGGLILSVFLIYESIHKLIYGEILHYTQLAFDYRIDQMGQSIEEANQYQIRVDARSYGLLQTHYVNAAFIAISGFAGLAYYYNKNIKKSIVFFIFTFVSLIVSMSFTVIVGFFVAVFFVGITAIFRKNVTLIRLIFLFFFLMIFTILGIISDGWSLLNSDSFFISIMNFIGAQVSNIFSIGGGNSVIDLYLSLLPEYLDYIGQNPFYLIFGDAFSGVAIQKGGDFGLLETILRFGLIWFIFLLTSFVVIIRNCLMLWARCKYTNVEHLFSFLLFIPAIFIIVIVSELHYGVYSYRVILSTMYIALAIYANLRQNLYF